VDDKPKGPAIQVPGPQETPKAYRLIAEAGHFQLTGHAPSVDVKPLPLPTRIVLNAGLVEAADNVAPALDLPAVLLQTVVERGERTADGTLIEAVNVPWFQILEAIGNNPAVAFEIPADRWEEIIAGAYKAAGFDEVTLTPRSGDHGRDVIAIKMGICRVRVIDQVKAYRPGHLVTANDVRALMGVLQTDGASKGCLSRSSSRPRG